MAFTRPQLFSEAISKLQSRTPIASPLDTRQWLGMPLAIRDRSLWSATIENARFMQRLDEALNDYLTDARELIHTPDGRQVMQRKVGNKAEFIQIMRRFAESEGMGPLDPRDADTIKDITSSARLGLIFDVQITSAREFGRWKQGQDPDILQEWPAYRFIRATDVATPRKLHEEYEFAVRLKSDLPFWLRMNDPLIGGFGVPWGPWGFNSGMDVEEVDRAESDSLGLTQPTDIIRPIEQAWNDHLEASAASLDPAQIAWIKSKLGPRVRVQGDRVILVPVGAKPTPPPSPSPAKKPAVAPKPAQKPAPIPPPAIRPTQVPVPPPLPTPAPTAPPVTPTIPVSKAIALPARGQLVKALRSALDAIDSVHSDGTLPTVPVRTIRMDALGRLRAAVSRLGGAVIFRSIDIHPSGGWPGLTIIHEIGHLLDMTALTVLMPGRGRFASAYSPAMKGIMDLIKQSSAYQTLLATRDVHAKQRDRDGVKHFNYLVLGHELWARAYAQYVAERSGDSTLLSGLSSARAATPGRQWETEDFRPIKEAIDTLFKAKGWL